MNMNAGDTLTVVLDYQINDTPIEQMDNIEEIEFMFNDSQYLLSTGGVYLDSETSKYVVDINQDASIGLDSVCQRQTSEMQVRFKIDGEVISDDIYKIHVGRTLSKNII